MSSNFKIDGMKELEASLNTLNRATAKNVLRRALRRGAEPLVQKAKQLAPDRPGKPRNDLVLSITATHRLNARQSRVLRNEGKAFATMHVGPDISVPHHHGHFQEWGTVRHGPQPFMRPAWDATKDDVLKEIGLALRDEIDKAVARAARRKAKGSAAGGL